MTLGFSRRHTTLFVVAVLALQLVLLSDHLKPVKAQGATKIRAIKSVLAYLFLLKTKSNPFATNVSLAL